MNTVNKVISTTTMANKDNIRRGRAGEYFAAYVLEKHGAETYRVDGAFDLICLANNDLIQIEVKSATASYKQAINIGQYKFYRSRAEHDYITPAYTCLVAIDRGVMRIVKGDVFTTKSGILTMSGKEFTHEKMKEDIRNFLLDCGFDDSIPEHWT